jgi:hypothetical protein
VQAQQKIAVRRFVQAPTIDASTPSLVTYLVKPPEAPLITATSRLRIPPQILSKIKVLISAPEYINMEGGSLPVTLRLRTKDLEESECKRLQVTTFSVDVIQIEKWRCAVSSSLGYNKTLTIYD